MTVPLEGVVIESEDHDAPTRKDLKKYPWKYIGYKDFTSHVASDSDFFAVRRFDRLHTRAILTLQAQLVEIEGRLDDMDDKFSSKHVKLLGSKPPRVIDLSAEEPKISEILDDSGGKRQWRDINNGTIKDDLEERARLVSDMTAKLEVYDKTMLNYSALRSLGPAPARNVKNLETWFKNNRGAITATETQFIQYTDELVGLFRPKSTFRQWFERHIVLRTKSTLGLFRKQPHPKTRCRKRPTVFLIDDESIDFVASITGLVMTSAMLVLPLWILQALEELRWKLTVITIFVILCQVFLSIAMIGRPFERLTASAGYLAILVVFLQFGNA